MPDEWKSFLRTIRANGDCALDEIACHGFSDLSVFGAYNDATTRMVQSTITATSGMPWLLWFPELPRKSRAAFAAGALPGALAGNADMDISDDSSEDSDVQPNQANIETVTLPDRCDGRPLKIMRTDDANRAQLAKDCREVIMSIGSSNLDVRYPVNVTWRQVKDGHIRKVLSGFLLMPSEDAGGARRPITPSWHQELSLLKMPTADVPYNDSIVDLSKKATKDCLSKGCEEQMPLRPRNQVHCGHRWQKGVPAYQPYIAEIVKLAEKSKMKAVALLEIGTGAGDLAMAAYSFKVDAHVAGLAVPVKVYVLTVDSHERFKLLAQLRLSATAFADYNASPPRLVISGTLAIPPQPAGGPSDMLSAVRSLQTKCKRIAVLVNDDGTNPRYCMPQLADDIKARSARRLWQRTMSLSSFGKQPCGLSHRTSNRAGLANINRVLQPGCDGTSLGHRKVDQGHHHELARCGPKGE